MSLARGHVVCSYAIKGCIIALKPCTKDFVGKLGKKIQKCQVLLSFTILTFAFCKKKKNNF